jgi:hypothetical protein
MAELRNGYPIAEAELDHPNVHGGWRDYSEIPDEP